MQNVEQIYSFSLTGFRQKAKQKFVNLKKLKVKTCEASPNLNELYFSETKQATMSLSDSYLM